MKDKVYTQEDLKSLNLVTCDYKFNMESTGEFVGVLDIKAETVRNGLRVFFTMDSGEKIIATVQWWQKYLHFYEIPVGTRLILTYTENSKGGIFLSAAQVMS